MQTRTFVDRLLGASLLLLACACSQSHNNHIDDAGPDGGNTADDPLDEFFGLLLHEIQVTVDQDSIDDLVAEPKVYTHAAVTIDGTEYEDVGFRLKGNAGSFIEWGGDYPEISQDGNGNPGKSAFIVDFNRWVGGTSFHGMKKLTVNNLVQDPTCVHEFLGYHLFRSGEIPASRSGWALVTINGEEKGLYALIETPDNSEFLNKHFGSNDGNLYEGEYGTDFLPDGVENFDQDNGDDETKDDLQALADALAAIEEDEDPLPVLEQHFDMENYLTFAVTELYLGHWDGYAQSANNYAVYHNLKDDKWTFLPWGIDQLFEDDGGEFSGIMTEPGPQWSRGGIVHQLCFRSPDCLTMLSQAYEDLFEKIETTGYASVAQEARELVEEQALAEATQHGDPDLTEEALDRVINHIDNRADDMSVWLPCLTGGSVDGDNDTYSGCDEDCDDNNPDRHPGATEECNFIDDDCNGIVDDPDECPKCLDETGPEGVTYSFCIEILDWLEAEQFCVNRGQHLASIHSDEEMEFTAWRMVDHFGAWDSWIGLNDRTTEGDYEWSDGSALDFENWGFDAPGMGEPAADCAINSPEGWRDTNCDELHSLVCRGTPTK